MKYGTVVYMAIYTHTHTHRDTCICMHMYVYVYIYTKFKLDSTKQILNSGIMFTSRKGFMFCFSEVWHIKFPFWRNAKEMTSPQSMC